ncbi:hypothetical protein, partial [Photobacterium sp. R1]
FAGYQQGKLTDGSTIALTELATIYTKFSEFAYVAQGVLDTVDPINTSLQVSADLPVYLTQVEDDATIPNMLAQPGTAG